MVDQIKKNLQEVQQEEDHLNFTSHPYFPKLMEIRKEIIENLISIISNENGQVNNKSIVNTYNSVAETFNESNFELQMIYINNIKNLDTRLKRRYNERG